MKKLNFHTYLQLLLLIAIIFLTIQTSLAYQGSLFIYLGFTVISISYLFLGLSKKSIFFETFMSLFFWLGFWVKFSIRTAFLGMAFNEPTGHFTGSSQQADKALLISSLGLAAFLLTTLIRRKLFLDKFTKDESNTLTYLNDFYDAHRKTILTLNILFFISVALVNFKLGIYQKGMTAATILPFGLNRIITWLILFGLTSINAVILHFESKRTQISFGIGFMALLECFTTNISLLSRGFILNGSSLIFAEYFKTLRAQTSTSKIMKATFLGMFLLFFITSIVFVNHLRSHLFYSTVSIEDFKPDFNFKNTTRDAKVLFIDRWVGIEGALSLASYPQTGWELFEKALKEKYKDNGTSFYDLNIIDSPYKNTDLGNRHFISLPGIIGFLFYPGSYLFVFAGCFIISTLAIALEFLIKITSGNNLFIMSLFGQVIAYRFAHFGYVPMQSYLLFGTIIVNILGFYFLNKYLGIFSQKRRGF